MLRELKETQQVTGEPFRRWFCDNALDLIVWHSPERKVIGFQLCYRENGYERALTWLEAGGFSHNRVDDGEGRPARHKMTPILVPDGVFDADYVADLFRRESLEIDPEVAALVLEKVATYPGCGTRMEPERRPAPPVQDA